MTLLDAAEAIVEAARLGGSYDTLRPLRHACYMDGLDPELLSYAEATVARREGVELPGPSDSS